MADNADSGDKQDKSKGKSGLDLGSLFKKKEPEKTGPGIEEVMSSINSLERRLRSIESKYNDLNRKIQFMDKEQSNERKRVNKDIKAADDINLEQKKEINKINEKMDRIIQELKNMAALEDVEQLKKYIEIWEPLNFVTRGEVKDVINEMLDDLDERKEKKDESLRSKKSKKSGKLK